MPDGASLAHPLTEAGRLPVAPLVVAALAVAVVAAVAMVGSSADRRVTDVPDAQWYQRRLGPLSVTGRAVMIVVLAAAVVAGRLGVNSASDNFASVIVMGVGLPALVLACLAFGRAWDHLDPWDGLARALGRLTDDQPPPAGAPPVTWAIPFAVVFGWYISGFRQSLLPRSVAMAVAAYTVVTVAGCLALGRVAWLTRAEVLGVVLRAIGRVRRGRLATWDVPTGAATVLGIVAGGFLFSVVRYSELWTPLSFGVSPEATDIIGFVVCAAAAVGLLGVLEWRARRVGTAGTPTAAAVPVVAALALAASMSRGQSLIAAQLVPAVLSDPLGRGWNLFGTANVMPNTNPLGDTWHIAVQVLLLLIGGVLGARAARQRAGEPNERRSRALGVTASAAMLVLGVFAVTTV